MVEPRSQTEMQREPELASLSTSLATDLFFVDDSRQRKPSRPGMSNVVAVGCVHVPSGAANALRAQIDELCKDYSFPAGEPFKYSPGPDLWMHDNLVRGKRAEFFIELLRLAKANGTKAIVVAEDSSGRTATPGAKTPELDVVKLLLERINIQAQNKTVAASVMFSRAGGDRKAEDQFVADCIETIQSGTDYVRDFSRIVSMASLSPKNDRLLQLADVVTSCTTAIVSGEKQFSPLIFPSVRDILHKATRIGGVGLKIHPDYKYANLYHWLVEDEWFQKAGLGVKLPLPDRPYATSPDSAET
ncbi:MAG: DUF3800 domain-containing protein [Chloroflexi bacterium]|nr:DUF3800 domain-containing protein [Chloroflexota bacterium]